MDEDPSDKALEDEDDEDLDDTDIAATQQQGGAQSKHTINQGATPGSNINVAPEDSVAPADREELMDDESPSREFEEPSFPARINVTVEKAGKGTMEIETVATDGDITIENVMFSPESSKKSVEEKADMYTGPPFGNLDQQLQDLIQEYLKERGVDDALAMWVPEYVDFKEQREYLRWLTSEFLPFFLFF